jgi:succinoglycan biosynthesis protein ExoA
MRQIFENYQPKVSVIMPVRNEADFIERSLRAIFRQSYPHDLIEIIIADGDSEDSTLAIIERLRAETFVFIQIVNNAEKIAPTGLNLAIRKASGEIIIRVDGHCEIAPDYIALCITYLQKEAADCIGGHIETISENPAAQAIAYAMSSKFGVGGSAFRCGCNHVAEVDTVAFPGYRRSVFERIGFFNEELVRNQDDEFNYRLRKAGGVIMFAPEIKANYYSRSNYKSLWRQYFQYGYWKVRVFQLHPKQMSRRQFVPFLFVVSLLVSIALSLFFEWGRIVLLILVTSYVSASAVASLFSIGRLKIAVIPRVMLSFAVLHLAYGFGFLGGLMTFRRRLKNNLPPNTIQEI